LRNNKKNKGIKSKPLEKLLLEKEMRLRQLKKEVRKDKKCQ